MNPRLSASPTSPPSMEVEPARARGMRLSHLFEPCRRLAIKFAENPRWGVMFTLGRFRFVSSAVVFFHRGQVVRPPAGVRSVEQAPSPPKLLIVGAGISLSGEITACDRLVVEGTAQVTLNQTRSIEIAESGRFTGGRADVEDAVIAGLYEGELTVRGRLLIRATGQVLGTVRYGELEVERGGRLTGTVAKRESDTQADTQGSHGPSRNIASLPMQRATDSEEEHRHDAIAVGGLGEGE